MSSVEAAVNPYPGTGCNPKNHELLASQSTDGREDVAAGRANQRANRSLPTATPAAPG